MKTILSVNNYHHIRGGSDSVYFAHAELFERNGWQNVFFSSAHEKNLPCTTSTYFPTKIDYGEKKPLATRLMDAAKIIYSREAQAKLSSLLDKTNVDVAHFHCIYHHLSPSVLVETRKRGIPNFFTAHDLKLACPAYKMMNSNGVCERCKGGRTWNVGIHKCIKQNRVASTLIMIESTIHKLLQIYRHNIDKIIAPSLFYRNKLVEWGWDPSSIVYIPNFVEIEKHNLSQSKRGDYVLYFGRLAPEKGLGTLIKASAKSGIRVKIAGAGPEERYLRELAFLLDAPVEFVGFQQGENLWHLVDGCLANALPSEWYENAPMSAIEAFARGKPLIGSNIGGIPELISEGETGWLFEPGDVDGLAEKLQSASSKSTDLDAMKIQTRNFVLKNFISPIYYERITHLYGEYGVR